jgi:hypothetical protein
MWTLPDAPAARSPRLQESVWLGAEPVMAQAPAIVWLAILQDTPLPLGPAGSGSETVTLRAIPVPDALLLLAVMT